MAKPLSYSISELYLFRVFGSREEYQRITGEEPPAYDPNRPPKFWFDPKALASTRRTIAYDPVLATTDEGIPFSDQGKPMLDILLLTKEEAASINIWHNQSGQPQPHLPPVPVPLRELQENEELFFLMPQVVSVRDKNKAQDSGMFTTGDRSLLQAIARKLDVSINQSNE